MRYEDLRKGAAPILVEILGLIGIDADPSVAAAAAHSAVSSNKFKGEYVKPPAEWREEAHAVMRPFMERFGYQ